LRALAAPRDDWLSVAEGRSRLLPPSPWDTPRLASRKAGLALPQISERRMNRRVPSVYHGLSGTKRERPISKGFLHCGMVHGFNENRTRISLKSLAIPAGFEPATHGVEIRYSDRLRIEGAGIKPELSEARARTKTGRAISATDVTHFFDVSPKVGQRQPDCCEVPA
jgi:hypothetical protein